MTRKIPGKKHRGVKDPNKQQLKQQEKLKLLINHPPSNPYIQEIPKTVLEINRLRELVKTGALKTKRKKKRAPENLRQKSGSSTKLWPRLEQKPDESDGSYLWRVNKATNDIINEALIEIKHDLDVVKDNEKINGIDGCKPVDSAGTSSKNKKKQDIKGGNKQLLDKKERMKLRRKLKLKKKNSKLIEDGTEKQKDHVKFGEVAHEPPKFRTRPKGCCDGKPGSRQLLLKSLFINKETI